MAIWSQNIRKQDLDEPDQSIDNHAPTFWNRLTRESFIDISSFIWSDRRISSYKPSIP